MRQRSFPSLFVWVRAATLRVTVLTPMCLSLTGRNARVTSLQDIANFRSAAEAGRHHRRHSPPLVGPSGVYHSEFNPMGGGARSSAMVFSGLEEQPMARRGNGGSFPSRPGSASVLMSRGMLERAERYGSPRETRERSAVWEDMALM
mmetsp:Transcript_6905/g.12525  ORF Transcript_6905/g.12525 Transcript_6905/m.12525 type:complete len:147 (-) Transcript_6905:303-743(-)